MEWLFILALAAVAAWQARRIGALSRRVAALEKKLAQGAAAQAPPAPYTPTSPAPANVEEEEPLLLTEALPPEEPLVLDQRVANDELLLDTPLPDASNDDQPASRAPLEPARAAQALPPAPPRAKRDFRFDQWLAEQGFAWIAGSALALGAIYLVSFATQQRWFTPQVQLALALTLGVVLLGASEWARRASLRNPPGNPLVAALLAGGGVVAFYATAWAAHGLYHLIDFPTAGALLALCALILIGLSLLHGQAIGVLAIFAAMLAPALAHEPLWPSAALSFFVVGVSVAGFFLAGLRRWGWVVVATLAGMYLWFWAAVAADDIPRALIMLTFASFGPIGLALRSPLQEESTDPLSWRRVHALGPTVVIAISSVFLVWLWSAVAPHPPSRVLGPAIIGAFHVALAAYAVRGRVASAPALIIAIAGFVLGTVSYLQARFYFGPVGTEFYVGALSGALAIVVSCIGANTHRDWRVATAATGAIGAALLFAFAASSREDWNAYNAWLPLFGGALVLFTAASFAARDPAPRSERVVDFWAGVACVLVLLGVESAFPVEARAPAHAGAALMFASSFAWRGWRVLRVASLFAATVTIAHALAPSLINAALTGAMPMWGALVILAVAAVLLFGAAYFATAEPRSAFGEALSAAGVITLLIAAFLLLRWLMSRDGASLDAFSETALRVIALMAAAHVVMARPGQDVGWIGRWRGHVLMGAGLLFTLLVPALTINPWWGAPPAAVAGPPLFDSLALAFFAPGVIALAAARRLYLDQRTAARIYAIAGGALALLWAVLEVRRAAHVQLAEGPVGLLEGAGYALLFLGVALGVAIFARMRAVKHGDGPFTQDLLRAMRVVAWGGLIAAGFTLLMARHPWWGAQNAIATDDLETGLAVLAQAIATACALGLGRALSLTRAPSPARFAAAAAALVFAWSFGHAAIRWLYHLGAMDNGAPLAGLEGFAHALWPLVFVIAGSALTERTPGRDTVRAYLHDLQALWSSAVWPALVFAALGLWLLFNPWWGARPATIETPVSPAAALGSLLLAAWLSIAAQRVPHVRAPIWFQRAATLACILHLLIAATLAVRWLHHGGAMATAPAGDVELWIYSALWAVFGAATFALGLRNNNAVVRWSGLAILLLTTFYVYFLIFTRLTGFIRALTAIGLAAVLFAVAWLARTYRPGPKPTDLLNITPAARREKRYGRRQRSQ